MKKLLWIGLIAIAFLSISALTFHDQQWIRSETKKAENNANAYTTTALSTFSSSSPFFSTGASFADTIWCFSTDTTDTMLIYWNSDTLWLSINGGVVSIPDLSGFLTDSWEDSLTYLMAKVDTLQTIVDSLGDSLGNIVVGGAGDSIPPGAIMLWSGAANKIPAGWCLCDSTNNADTFAVSWVGDTIAPPNLSNMFVLSYGSKYAVNDTGGLDSLTMTGTTGAGSAHTHTISGLVLDSTVRYPGTGTKIYIPRLSVGTNLPTNANENAHTHTFTGTKQTNMPPYYVLCYIFKL